MKQCISIRLCVVVVAMLSMIGAAAAQPAKKDQPNFLHPVRLQQVKVRGFWRDQAKRLTEKWIPHCIRQMEKGGKGQELLNFVRAGKVLAGKPAGKFTGFPWSDAYVYNTIESICLALAVEPEGDAELAGAQAALRGKLDEWIPIVLAAQIDDGYIHTFQTVNKQKRYTNMRLHEF
ncbi:MAG: glycoside hydrolase family 127 protein, partial [Phycisphaerae bacterium]|nr:glycoside hydrolase family 127 protein [Phycisphaerae bacterium]